LSHLRLFLRPFLLNPHPFLHLWPNLRQHLHLLLSILLQSDQWM
jgi:hypothetical protein